MLRFSPAPNSNVEAVEKTNFQKLNDAVENSTSQNASLRTDLQTGNGHKTPETELLEALTDFFYSLVGRLFNIRRPTVQELIPLI